MDGHYHDNCESLLGALSNYIDGELPPEVCTQIEAHLSGCENCRAVLNTTRRTIDLVHVLVEKNTDLPEEMRERLLQRLKLDQEHGKKT